MSTQDKVIHILKQVLAIGPRADTFSAGTVLLGALPEFDSMAVVNVVAAIEDEFGIVVGDDEIDASAFATVGALAAFVEGKLAA
ncbi:MAG: acyl carrier protein [Gammaproteobacteria bacterium]